MTGSSRVHGKTRRVRGAWETPVRAIALSISSVPVAAPALGHDPPPSDDGLLARARENAKSAWGVLYLLEEVSGLRSYPIA